MRLKRTLNDSQKIFFRSAILVALLTLSRQSHAQILVNGYLKDRALNYPIIHGEIRSSLGNTLSDSNGFFRIRVADGDIISAKKFGYRFDTIHFSIHRIDTSLIIYMEPLGSLMKNVTVRTSYSPYQVDSNRRRILFDEGRSKTTFVSKQSHQGFGLVLNLDRVTKSNDKHLKRQREIFEKTEQWAYVRYRFSDSIVHSYTGLTSDSLHRFMNLYTPSYEWLRAHPSKLEVLYYINDKLKLYRKDNH